MSLSPPDGSSISSFRLDRIGLCSDERIANREDAVAIEEPLEIRLEWMDGGAPQRQTISITMRTPGEDDELAAGFLFTEGIVRERGEIAEIAACGPQQPHGGSNIVRVTLSSSISPDLARLERHFYTASSCGICGKTSIEAVRIPYVRSSASAFSIDSATIHRLEEELRGRQETFDVTGGLHASGLFSREGELRALREDVGRHNALDKVIGREFLAGRVPLASSVLMVSGRASFELVQKAAVAGIPLLAAVGAPSSLAVDLAREAGMTLLGFVRNRRFNVYAGAERLR
ncbi:MAG: formate dehydrogenase accessory sulfurtransferase FdhD [Thermoanaerobaculia bacterium]